MTNRILHAISMLSITMKHCFEISPFFAQISGSPMTKISDPKSRHLVFTNVSVSEDGIYRCSVQCFGSQAAAQARISIECKCKTL